MPIELFKENVDIHKVPVVLSQEKDVAKEIL